MGSGLAIPLKMFGLQRSCNNITLRCLLDRFHVKSLEKAPGAEWKHGPPAGIAAKKSTRCVFCFRSPWAWLPSMFRWSHSDDRDNDPKFDRGWTFAEFLRRPHYDWPSPVARWNAINRIYVDFAAAHPDRCGRVHAERMTSNTAVIWTVTDLGRRLALAPRAPEIEDYTRRIDNCRRWQPKPMNYGDYLERRYLAYYSEDDLALVWSGLDKQLLADLGYSREG